MGTVRTFVVTEKRNFTLGVGDTIYECAPGTVLYEPWLSDARGMSTFRLEHLGMIAPLGTVDESAVPDFPGVVLAEGDGVTHVGPGDKSDEPRASRVHVVDDAGEAAPADGEGVSGDGAHTDAGEGGEPGDGAESSPDTAPIDEVVLSSSDIDESLLGKLVDEQGAPIEVPDGGDASTAEAQGITAPPNE